MSCYLIWHGFKEDRRRGDLLLLSHEAMSQVTSIWKVQSHDPSMRLHKGRIDGKVSGRT